MASRLNPYISFQDTARSAMEHYQKVFGGELTISTFGDMGMTEAADLVMHASLETPAGYTIMAADTPPGMEHSAGGQISVSVSGDDEEALRGYWEGLGEGGTVTMPLEKQMWGDVFGMVTDRFGIQWMVNIAGAQQG
jgi:PhnB protein